MTLPWIKLFVDMPDHPKCDELAVAIGCDEAWTKVVALWCWAAKHRPDGDLGGLSDGVIAKRARWSGNAAAFVAALERVGFLDGRRLHDFAEEQEAHAKKIERDRARMAEKRAGAAGVARPSRDGPATVPREREIEKETEKEIDREGVPGTDGVAPAAPPAPAPVLANRPEPLGPYGEVYPGSVDGVLAFVHEGKPLLARWLSEAKPLDELGIRRVVERAMAHRQALEGPRLRSWFWPGGFVTKVDPWMRDEAKKALDHAAAEGRAAKAGVHISTSPAATVDPRRKKLEAHWRARAGPDDLPPFHVWVQVVEADGTADTIVKRGSS